MGDWAGTSIDRAAPPRIALEGAATAKESVATVLAALRAAGCRVEEGAGPSHSGRTPRDAIAVIRVRDAAEAEDAVRWALDGYGFVIVAEADRTILDRLYDDLRRFGRLEVRARFSPAPDDALDADERSLLALLAEGHTLGVAAARLHMSRRTADRRLASARERLGARTTAAALAMVRPPSRAR